MTTAGVAFALAAALHAGFQLTVTVLVYPVLARVPASSWSDAHARHSRLIVPLVGLTYAGLVAAGAWLLASSPGPLGLAAVLAAAGSVVVTAVAAAPTHGRLVTPDPALLRRLLVVDRLRGLFAVLALVLAVAALG
ncbi:hypothetical protein [Nocardioides psychrotolerans]|uniref:hypothetical protein n=1 Tax=Nocardioides psychrotolerans TaxID=1005945 RepID=UPI003137AFB3